MDKITVNLTVKLDKEEVIPFENWLREQIEVKDFTIVPNTDELYKNDNTFRKLIKQKKELTKRIWEYQNKHN